MPPCERPFRPRLVEAQPYLCCSPFGRYAFEEKVRAPYCEREVIRPVIMARVEESCGAPPHSMRYAIVLALIAEGAGPGVVVDVIGTTPIRL